MNLSTRKNELINEVIYSMPSKRMIDVVNIGSVNYKGKNIILKFRCEEKDLSDIFLKFPPLVYDKFIHDFNHDYADLVKKNVSFDISILSKRGIVALNELVEICDEKFITKF